MLYRISRSFFFARSTALLYYRASVSRKFRTRRDVLLSRCRGITSGNIEDGIHRKRKVITRCHWVKYNSKRNAKAVVNRGAGISFLPWISVLFRGILPFAYPTPSPPSAFFYYSNGIPPLSNRSGEFTDVFVPRLLSPLLTGRNLFDTSGDSVFG